MKLEEAHKDRYKILLGGSTIAGKTTYFNSYFEKQFKEKLLTSTRMDYSLIKELNQNSFFLLDTTRWGGRFVQLIKIFLKDADGVILMFDLSYKNDFDNLPNLLNMITEFHELENFPVLLIGNRSDLDIEVDENEIKKFMDKENFVGYFEVSCKTHKNVEESVDFMVNYIYKKKRKKFFVRKNFNV